MCTILVSGVSGVIGYGILKSLRQSHPNCRLVGATVYERNAGRAFCDVFEKAPMTSDESYLSWLIEVIERWNVSIAIPGIEADVLFWNEHRTSIEGCGAVLLLNNPELIRLCSDKWIFYQRLVECNSPYSIPTGLYFDRILGDFPLLAKPRRGSGGRGVSIIDNMECFERHHEAHKHAMIYQPIIGDANDEYTCSAFFDKNSKLCAFVSMKRTLSLAGFTESAETVELAGIDDALKHLGDVFKPVGPTNFQFRLDKGELKLLEINPRISSATSIRTAFGYNESGMAVDLVLSGIAPCQPEVKHGYAVRYMEDTIFYDSNNI